MVQGNPTCNLLFALEGGWKMPVSFQHHVPRCSSLRFEVDLALSLTKGRQLQGRVRGILDLMFGELADSYRILGPGSGASRVPAVMLSRLASPLESLLARGIARQPGAGVIELTLDEEEARQGGMAAIPMFVRVRCSECAGFPLARHCTRCQGTREVEERYSAWLAIPPGVADGSLLTPSVDLPGMIDRITFRVRRLPEETSG